MDSSSSALELIAMIIITLDQTKTSIDNETRYWIKKSLANAEEIPSEKQVTAINIALDALGKHPVARSLLRRKLQSLMSEKPESKSTSQIRSFLYRLQYDEPIGILYACPIDPDHYRRRYEKSTEHPNCPQHGVPLNIYE